MSQSGECLKIRFSVSNQSGVLSNDLQMDENSVAPDMAVFEAEVNALFGGSIVNCSRLVYTLTETEKIAALDVNLPRYSRKGVGGTYWRGTEPADKLNQVGFYLAGIADWVSDADIKAFLFASTTMPDGQLPNQAFIGAKKFLE